MSQGTFSRVTTCLSSTFEYNMPVIDNPDNAFVENRFLSETLDTYMGRALSRINANRSRLLRTSPIFRLASMIICWRSCSLRLTRICAIMQTHVLLSTVKDRQCSCDSVQYSNRSELHNIHNNNITLIVDILAFSISSNGLWWNKATFLYFKVLLHIYSSL